LSTIKNNHSRNAYLNRKRIKLPFAYQSDKYFLQYPLECSTSLQPATRMMNINHLVIKNKKINIYEYQDIYRDTKFQEKFFFSNVHVKCFLLLHECYRCFYVFTMHTRVRTYVRACVCVCASCARACTRV